jgi:hypothetical protein
MTLQLLHSKFSYIWGEFDFLFYQCGLQDGPWIFLNLYSFSMMIHIQLKHMSVHNNPMFFPLRDFLRFIPCERAAQRLTTPSSCSLQHRKTTGLVSDTATAASRLSQRDVVYLGWPIAPSYMSPNAGGGGVAGLGQWVMCKWSPKKLWRSNSIFNPL